MGEEQSDDLELDGPITLRILDEIAWDFAQAKWWRWWKTVRCGGLILSYCPRNPHGKAGTEERRRRRRPYNTSSITLIPVSYRNRLWMKFYQIKCITPKIWSALLKLKFQVEGFYNKGAFALDAKRCEAMRSDAKQANLDVIDNLRKVSTGRKLPERLLNFS